MWSVLVYIIIVTAHSVLRQAAWVVSAGDPGPITEMPIIVCRTPHPLSLPSQAVLSLESHRDHLLLTPSGVPCVVKSSPLQKQMAPAQAPLVRMSAKHLTPVMGSARPWGCCKLCSSKINGTEEQHPRGMPSLGLSSTAHQHQVEGQLTDPLCLTASAHVLTRLCVLPSLTEKNTAKKPASSTPSLKRKNRQTGSPVRMAPGLWYLAAAPPAPAPPALAYISAPIMPYPPPTV